MVLKFPVVFCPAWLPTRVFRRPPVIAPPAFSPISVLSSPVVRLSPGAGAEHGVLGLGGADPQGQLDQQAHCPQTVDEDSSGIHEMPPFECRDGLVN